MAKIKGKFAPLTQELGEDERFIIDCTDFEKLMYILIILTTHMTHHQAPINPSYYKHRYGIRARYAHIKYTIDTLLTRFPKLKCSDGKLSLLNSATYKTEIFQSPLLEEEVEVEVKQEVKRKAPLGFENFWNNYPKKRSKGQAEKAWQAIKPNEQLQDRILKAIERAKTSAGWLKDGGQFIPYPASWLNAKGWEDDYESGFKESARDRIRRITENAKQVQ